MMLSAPGKNLRVKAAVVLAALYAICILAPAAAFAFSDSPAAAHCLIEGHVGIHVHGDNTHVHGDNTHVHADATAHEHRHGGTPQQQSRDQGAVADCCGLFSVVALTGEPGFALGAPGHASVLVPAPPEALNGRGPERLYRPPISLPSL